MFNKLTTNNFPTITSPLLTRLRYRHRAGNDEYETTIKEFVALAGQWLKGTQLNKLTGFDAFPIVEATMGCNHFIDNLIMKHGLDNLQIFEHDYRYYERLHPGRTWTKVGGLVANRPVLLAMPVPGYLGAHPQLQEILDEASAKGCPVHLDGSWMTAARDIEFNFNHPAVHSFAMSLSKGMDLWWNRVGIRWSRVEDDTDSITIYNKHNMIPVSILEVGIDHLTQVPVDHLWKTYKDKYEQLCKELKLRPTKLVHVVQSIDRSTMYGIKELLENK